MSRRLKNEALTKQQTEAVLEALDNAISQGPWEESNFLRLIGKNLRGIREEFVSQVNSSGIKYSDEAAYVANEAALRRGQKKVYIALYSSDGSNLRSWEWILANLPGQMISRPIYAEEQDVRAIIKSKENKNNEAYVALYIDENDILPISADKLPIDKLGKYLIALKDGTLNLNNIDYFVHLSGTYQYSHGRLIKQ